MTAKDDRVVDFYREVVRGVDVLHASYTRWSYALHAHDFFAVGVFMSGGVRFRYRGSRIACGPQAVMALDPEEPHDGSPFEGGFTKAVAYFGDDVICRMLDRPDEEHHGRRVRTPVIADPALFSSFADWLQRAPSAVEPLSVEAAFAGLIEKLFRSGAPGAEAVPRPRQLEKARALLHDAYNEVVTLAALSELAGLSRAAFVRAFTRTYGLPPHRYLLMVRLRAARRDLANGSDLAQAALRNGFCDQAHLTRRFRDAYGYTPGAYRDGHDRPRRPAIEALR